MSVNILILDDEPGLRKGLKKVLNLEDYKVFEAENCDQAENVIKNKQIHILLLDLKLGAEDGYIFLKKIKKTEQFLSVIIITGYGDVKSAVACLKAGAVNYITKPIDHNLLISILKKESNALKIHRDNLGLRVSLKANYFDGEIKSNNSQVKNVEKIIQKIKNSPVTLLISGETGTGKELTARKIHYAGIYHDRPFMGINCAALNDNLLESELFGHEKGSFTGAYARKLGRFELVGSGTLFLDEIGDMSLSMQAKLLRVLQENTFERVGGTQTIESSCRVISATNKDLNLLMKQKKFRADLYYRLSLVRISLPPLKSRKEDIPAFVDIFIKQANLSYFRNVKGVSEQVMHQLINYHWPGNIRQLRNIITNAVIMSEGDVIYHVDISDFENDSKKNDIQERDLKSIIADNIKQVEVSAIKRMLKKHDMNISRTALELGVTRKTLYKKIKKYNL